MTIRRHRECVSNQTLAWLLGGLGLVMAPHALHVPLWLTATVIACGCLRYVLSRRGERLPGRTIRLLGVIAGTSAIYLSYGTILGLDAGVALLCLMASFKLLEMRTRRDVLVALLLGYFLIATHLIYAQTLLTVVYLLVTVWALTTLLITTQKADDGSRPLAHTRLAATMLAQALPIMVILFVLFPRVPGPLWSMPDDAYVAMTGLSDEMSPGSISELSQSDEVALRAEFAGDPPPRPQRYWRGPVLSDYDGRTWAQAGSSAAGPPEVLALTNATDYTITLEPHNKPWLLTLDIATGVDRAARFDAAHQLEQENPVRERIRYQARSVLQYQLGETLSGAARNHYTQLPDDAHPRSRELARTWRQEQTDDAELIEHGLGHFRREPFTYTLQPPRLDGDSIDEFLFGTRSGFCEHFAAAFTVLMRAAGIPARVVTGYLGGRMNPAGDYMIVRQSDAHAWVEVWLEGDGWRRVDPTGYVAPDRIEQGLAGALPQEALVPRGAFEGNGLRQHLSLRWDAINAYWNRWVLAYSPALQQHLMDRLNLGSWQRVALAIAASMALALAGLATLILRRSRQRPMDPAAAAWQRFCSRLARHGLHRRPDEGPRDFARRAAARWPTQADAIDAIAQRYGALRYGRRGGKQELRALHLAIRRLRLNS